MRQGMDRTSQGEKGWPLQRVQYWDIAKGIAIMLMILGHTEAPVMVRGAIFSFHMPFFVIANGYFIKSYDIKRTFLRSARSLLVPYVIVCMLSAVIYPVVRSGDGPVLSLFLHKIKAMVGGMSKVSTRFQSFDSVWVIWFVCALFITRNLYVVIMHFFQKNKWLCYGLIAVLAYAGYRTGQDYAFLPWSLDVALVALIFIALGDWMRRSGFLDKELIYTLVLPAAVWVSCVLILRSSIDMSMRSYPAGIFTLVEAAAGSILLISVSRYLEHCRWIGVAFAWIGKNSMIILGIHCIELMYMDQDAPLLTCLPVPMTWISVFMIKSILILSVAGAVVNVHNGLKRADRKR